MCVRNVLHTSRVIAVSIYTSTYAIYMRQTQIQTTNLRSNTKMSLILVLPSSPCSPNRLPPRVNNVHMMSNRIPCDSQSSGLTPCSSYFNTEHVTGGLNARSKKNAAQPQKYVLRASISMTDVARRSANYQSTVLDSDFIQSLTSPFSVIYYPNSFIIIYYFAYVE